MIITKTPFRMSFFGGGSDLAEFYQKFQGATLSITINKYMYISSHDFFEPHQYRLKYSRTETVDQREAIQHPIFRTVLNKLDIPGGLEISSIADIPGGTGLGSSSSFTVGLLHNLYSRLGQFITKSHLAAKACDIEIKELKEPIGKQDQFAAAFGGLNVISYAADETVSVEPLYLRGELQKDFRQHLQLFYTGKSRSASSILEEQKAQMKEDQKVGRLKRMVQMVYQGRELLLGGQWKMFGELLHESWLLKREMASGVTNAQINEYYDCALREGAYGGKILGAGGGGFLLICSPPNRHDPIAKSLISRGLQWTPFEFEYEGSKVIYAES